MKTGSHFLLAAILLLAAAPAEAGHRHPAWWRQDGRVYAVRATACDPVSRRCTPAIRYFSNPVWR